MIVEVQAHGKVLPPFPGKQEIPPVCREIRFPLLEEKVI